MKQLLTLLMMSLLTVATMQAQNIQGTVTDKRGAAVPFATVAVLAADSAYIDGTTCDDAGQYVLAITPRAALLRASCVGYETVTVPVSQVDIVIPESGVALDAVQVVSMRQLVKTEADRLTYNMQADPDAETNNLLEMLRKVPLVSVDGEENVRVNGTTAYKIYKNGHPDPSMSTNAREVLRSIPANMIKRIEVITEPGARYDAEGATAILNIVMVEGSSLTGINGTVNLRGNTFASGSASADITGRVGKLTLNTFMFLHYHSDRVQTTAENDYTYLESGMNMHSSTYQRNPSTLPGLWLNASYEFDTLNLVSVTTGGHYFHMNLKGGGTTAYTDASGNVLSSFENTFHWPKYGGTRWNSQVDFEHRTHRPDEVLTFSYMLSHSNTTNDARTDFYNLVNPSFAFTGYDEWSKERFNEHTLQIDYQLPLFSHHRLETGAKYIYRQNRSHTIMTHDNDPSTDTDIRFHHDTHVAAAYLSWQYNTGPVSMRAGLRYEFSRLNASYPDGNGTNYSSNLNDWVPSASINWNINQFNSLRLSYASSINRPGISYLNPAVVRNATMVSYGNDHLGSAHVHSLRLTFQHVGDKLTFNLTPSVGFTRNLIGSVQFVEDNLIHSTYSNSNRYFMTGMSGFVQWAITPTTSFMLNGEMVYKRYHSPSLGLTGDGLTGNFYTQVSQRLPWRLRLTASCMWYMIGHDVDNVYGYTTFPAPTYSLSLQRSFLKDDRLSVRLTADHIFSRYQRMEGATERGEYLSNTKSKYDERMVEVAVSWRFGSTNTQVKKTATSITNDDLVGGSKN